MRDAASTDERDLDHDQKCFILLSYAQDCAGHHAMTHSYLQVCCLIDLDTVRREPKDMPQTSA